jgi:hypothetical protein
VKLAANMGHKLQGFKDDVSALKKALANTISGSGTSKPKLSKPKTFDGVQSSKELENFLWDMEQYFSVAKIDRGGQMNIIVMYLMGDAKLWWRTRIKEDLNVGHPKIETWERLKQELKEQFLLNNTS